MTPQPGLETTTIHILPNISQRQPDNEIWSINRIYQEKYFSLKIMPKMIMPSTCHITKANCIKL